jgi:radical SAM-linked protein
MRLRARYTKLGKIRFTSHRDVARMWERALRRTGVPIAMSEGFTPRPRMHFGLALSTGHESLAEYLDLDFVDEVPLDDLPDRFSAALPAGVECVAVAPVAPGLPSLQEAVVASSWQIDALGVAEPAVRDAVERVLASAELPVERERKGKVVSDDIRPAVLALEVTDVTDDRAEGTVRLLAELATQPRGVRPRELLDVVAAELYESRVLRLAQWTSPDGASRVEPLPRYATSAPHAGARAS